MLSSFQGRLIDEQFLPTDSLEERRKKEDKIKNRARNWYIKRSNKLFLLCFDKFKEFDEFTNRLYFYHQKAIVSIIKIVQGKGFILKTIDKNGVQDDVTCLWEVKDALPQPRLISVEEDTFVFKSHEKIRITYTEKEAFELLKDYNLCFSEGLQFTELLKILGDHPDNQTILS